MHELRHIVRAADESPHGLILATVVDVVGSSYRRPTARMLIFPDGKHTGTISGGCLERDLSHAAPELVKHGPKLVSFDTRSESTNFNPRYNLGCSGIIYVLVEAVTHDALCPLRFARNVFDTRRSMVSATIYQSTSKQFGVVGRRFRDVDALLSGLEPSEELSMAWKQVESDGRPTCCELHAESGEVRLMIEKISPPQPLWVFGAGDDALPLVAMASQLGWDVTVFDHRASRLSRDRFPDARLVCRPWHEATSVESPTSATAAVLLTHSFDADKLLLPSLLKSRVGYVGVLGPKSRTGSVMRELHDAGKLPNASSLDRLHTPMGLDLGAATPAEIAVSVLAEIIASNNERRGGQLATRQAPIHEPVRHRLIELRELGNKSLRRHE